MARSLRGFVNCRDGARFKWLPAEIFRDVLPDIVFAYVGLVPEHCPAGELVALRSVVDHDPVGGLMTCGGGVGFEAVDCLRPSRHGVNVLCRSASLGGVDGRRIAIGQADRGVRAAPGRAGTAEGAGRSWAMGWARREFIRLAA